MVKEEILSEALQQREKDILYHQVNIDNYKLSLQEIDKNYIHDPDMLEFRDRLSALLKSSIIEQRKEIIMRDVIAKQLEALCSTS